MIHTLEADGIQLEFNGRKILYSVYLKLETGKITALLGRNGTGKTCLMNIIYGSLYCEKSVRIDQSPQKMAYQRPDLLRYLPQFNFIPPQFSLKKIFNDFELEYAAFEQSFTEFSSKYRHAVGRLSGGERRLVELYVILQSKSQFVMLDEPFTHLNPVQIEKVKELLQDEKRDKGLLITDHMYKQVVDICDDLYVLVNGRVHLAKSIDDVEQLGYVRL
jgi:ABC-type lipopolysaccharide export system ATPase subunit